jgi:two-component sensor histidine kinase
VQSDSVAVKAALLDVVDFLHQWADVHRALRMPDQGRLTDAARYLQQLCFAMTKYRLDCLAIRALFSADDLRLEGERCWKLGLIVSELLTNVARHVQFDVRHPELRVKLMLAGNIVKCGVSDNGSAPEPIRRGRGLTIVGELVSSLGGRSYVLLRRRGLFPSHLPIDRGRATCRGPDSSCSVEAEKGAPPSAVGGVKVGQPGTVFIMALTIGRSIAGSRSESHR